MESANLSENTSSLFREDARRKTFTASWPHSSLDPKLLAQTGFYYLGSGDSVKCFFCELQVIRWAADDNVISEHLRMSPDCKLLRRRPTKNVAENEEDLQRILPKRKIVVTHPSDDVVDSTHSAEFATVRYPQYANDAARLLTYDTWPMDMMQLPHQMCVAGFFYINKDDRVICFSCGGGLHYWEDKDDPWEQHAQWFPHCEYLKEKKGQQFIDQIQYEFQMANAL